MTVMAAATGNTGLPTWAYVFVGVAVVLGPLLTALILLKKQPAETRKITVDTVDVNVKVAGELRDDAVEAWRTARDELTAATRAIAQLKLDREADQDAANTKFERYKADVEERMESLTEQLRGKIAENTHLVAELERRDSTIVDRDRRIGQLETEVRELKTKVERLENGNGDTAAGPHV